MPVKGIAFSRFTSAVAELIAVQIPHFMFASNILVFLVFG
jgi:hypothetical protein